MLVEDNDRGNYMGSTKSKTGGYISIVDYYDDDEEKNVYCSHCWNYGFEVKLGPRLLKKGEPVPPDHDQFLQCYECGTIYPIYEIKHESKIEDFVQPVDNPFELSTDILGTDSRASQRRKGKKRKSRFSHKQEHEDPEIQSEINKGNTVRIMQDY